MAKKHTKHPKITKPSLGFFGRTELAILGTTCGEIEKIAKRISAEFQQQKVLYVDSKHFDEGEESNPEEQKLVYKKGYAELNVPSKPDIYSSSMYTNDSDLILINGNHHQGTKQIVVIDKIKSSSLLKRIHQVTDLFMILVKDGDIPDLVHKKISNDTPVYPFHETEKWLAYIGNHIDRERPPVYGLLLNGGKSSRMGVSKAALQVGNETMFQRSHRLLNAICEKTFCSIRVDQIVGKIPVIHDRFIDFGPYGGILSAFMKYPDVAWLVMAVDMPRVSQENLQLLLTRRNSSKLATAFHNEKTGFPDPLLTIWEPKAYAHLLRFVSIGYSCPRKVLINSEIETIKTENQSFLDNINTPEDYTNYLEVK